MRLQPAVFCRPAHTSRFISPVSEVSDLACDDF
jgi:hypothetical protein